MKAVILVAGYATRLYPLTLNMPKALLPINDKTILDCILDEVDSIDSISEVILVSNSKFISHFSKWQEENYHTKKITVLDDGSIDEKTKRGAIGDILFAIDDQNINEDIVVIAGDNYFTFKLIDYYNYFLSVNKDCVCVKEINDINFLRQIGVAQLDSNNRVIDFCEKPQVPLWNTGVFAVYFFKKETLPLFKMYIDNSNNTDAPGSFIEWLCKNKEVLAYKFTGDCFDIGTPKAYDDLKLLLKQTTPHV